jgi:hypothetical protein
MAADKILAPRRTAQITLGGLPSQVFSNWCESVSGRLNGIEGEGSPVGVVDAPRLTYYVNILTDEVYLKRTRLGDTSGWLLLS